MHIAPPKQPCPRGPRAGRGQEPNWIACPPRTEGLNVDSKYEMVICWSEEDGAFVVEVPELPGCMADGRTYDEAVANAQAISHEWTETAAQLGRPVPQPKGRLA